MHAVVIGSLGARFVDLEHDTSRPLLGVERGRDVTFSPDGKTFVDGKLALWDVATGVGRETYAGAVASRLLDDKLLVVTSNAILELVNPPRDRRALKAVLVAQPYEVKRGTLGIKR